ncbi:MAG: glycosyltransferase family 39 protein [Flavobacteriales bacterium]|nr:glycosyltransferase family 39 protein [Flavobacteriales bacterium]
MALVVIAAFLLRLGPSLDPCLHKWDERYHALVAKHLIAEPLVPMLYDDPALPHIVGAWDRGHIWLNKPPLSLWSIALSLKCFGMHAWAVRLPSVLLSAFAALLLFELTLLISTRRTAFWTAFLFAIQGHLIELASGRTSNDHPDTFLMLFVLASIYTAVRMSLSGSLLWASISGASCGLAFLSKSWPALIVMPVAFLLVRRNRALEWQHVFRCMGLLALTAMVVGVPWMVYTARTFPVETAAAATAHWQHFTMNLEEHGRPWSYYLTQLPMIHGGLAPLALIWFLVGPFRDRPREHAWLLVWWVLPYMIFSAADTKMPGYTVIAVSAVCIIIAMAIDRWTSLPHGDRWRIPGLFGAIGLVLMPLHFSLDRTRPWERATPRYAIPDMLLDPPPGTVIINCPVPVEVMFYTPVAAAYEGPMTKEAGHLSRIGYVLLDWKELQD